MGNSLYTYEELNTLLVQIEGAVNSRPLHPLSRVSLMNLPVSLLHIFRLTIVWRQCLRLILQKRRLPNRLSLWNQIQKMRQLFWKRWSTAYLNSLQKVADS
jgi:hypothetical protein